MIKNILLISSGQPSANPRLVKEAISLFEVGFRVTVIYCPLSPWADAHDLGLFERYPQINWYRVGSHPQKNKFTYHFARLRRKFFEYIFRYWGNCFNVAEGALVLFSEELKSAASNIKADLYIGHNLGALPAVVAAARKFKVKAVFDFEDYHRGENELQSFEARLVECVEERYVPMLAYATTASPLITKAYKFHFPDFPVYTINNCFPRAYAPKKLQYLSESPLKLFWFSQYVGKNRGLEQVIAAIAKTGKSEIQLTLLGNCSSEMREYFTQEAISNGVNSSQLHFISPVPESEIAKIAAEHHIGLAVEVPHIENREYCLTNKIFMYLLAGNAIIFSDTKAQKEFLQNNPGIGSVFSNGDIDRLAFILSDYYNQPERLQQHREASYFLGQSYNWDNEKEQFLTLVTAQL